MKQLIKELRRRQVFRTVGLYIGGVWISLQVADTLLPAFDAPNWVFQALVGIAIIGLPVAIGLAWTFDLTIGGVHRESDSEGDTAEAVLTKARKTDFVVIGVLLLALSISVFVNLSPREPVVVADIEPISVLIADFGNRSGESVFEGTLEQVLSIGIEVSSFVTAFDRQVARGILKEINSDATLDAAGARLVSIREGLDVVVSGELTADGGKYLLTVNVVDSADGDAIAVLRERANDKTEVLAAVDVLSRGLRTKLGDATVDEDRDGEETFTTVSLEAMHDYVVAQDLARDGKDEEAIQLYEAAIAKDREFSRAYSGLAVSAHKLGMTERSGAAWAKVMEFPDSMTERERLRSAGAYYALAARNIQKAIESYSELVEKYPADNSGHNNLAVSYFYGLNFDKALQHGREVVEIYPQRPMYHANYALYAMYASDFDTAKEEAAKTLEINPNYHKAYLPYAVAALVDGDIAAARLAYERMAGTGARGASLASIGLADLLLWSGDAPAAEQELTKGMQADKANGNQRGLATKQMMRAYALLEQERGADEIIAQISGALSVSRNTSQLVSAALLFIELDQDDQARRIADELSQKLETQQRAYAALIRARLQRDEGDKIAAITALQQVLTEADLWLIRFELGTAYLDAGHFIEARSEFDLCQARLGEAYSLFLDDTPTFRYAADLDGWSARARNIKTVQR